MEPIFLDTETCGLHGMPVLLQYAIGEGDIVLYDIWKKPIRETLSLVEDIFNHSDGIVGFNLTFDLFHLIKLYTTFSLYPDKNDYPDFHIDELAVLEKQARFGKCLKPKHILDLMLHARKGPYQSTMDRKPIRIKRVPKQLADALAEELNIRVKFNDIYFARSASKKQWHAIDIVDFDGETDPNFMDIVLNFAPSSALKALAFDALGYSSDDIIKFKDIQPDECYKPVEYGWAPFALAGVIDNKRVLPTGPGNWRHTWPMMISYFIDHWSNNDEARQYASDDITYTRGLYNHFGKPAMDDDDSVLAGCVAACRWKGYAVDVEALKKLKVEAQAKIAKTPTAPRQVKAYLSEVMSEVEQLALVSTKKNILEAISKFDDEDEPEDPTLASVAEWSEDTVCQACKGMGCVKCGNDGFIKSKTPHPAAVRAKEVLTARAAVKEIELYDKIIQAGRFHASFKVIGTLSSRMAGGDGLNAQGIKHDTYVRKCFTLADDDMVLCGGDFDAFEVCLGEAEYKDPKLREALLSGKKIHAIFGVFVFKPMTYDEIMADKHIYSKSKQGVFVLLYGGEGYTLQDRLGVSEEVANEAYKQFVETYVEVGKARQRAMDLFCSMRQPNGIGTAVEWHEPAEYIESLFGFRRYFTLENRITRALFDLAQDPPKKWLESKIKVVRRDREQSQCGAVRSALYAAAFGVQSACMRAACNHRIQSSGATINKNVQRAVWDVQPAGVNDWLVQPMNVHDENMSPCHKSVVDKVKTIVGDVVAKYKETVPLILMDWRVLETWASK